MISLINIERQKNIVQANYYESDIEDLGFIKYDIEKKQVVDFIYNEEDKRHTNKTGYHKSIKAIELLVKYNKFPNKYNYVWY